MGFFVPLAPGRVGFTLRSRLHERPPRPKSKVRDDPALRRWISWFFVCGSPIRPYTPARRRRSLDRLPRHLAARCDSDRCTTRRSAARRPRRAPVDAGPGDAVGRGFGVRAGRLLIPRDQPEGQGDQPPPRQHNPLTAQSRSVPSRAFLLCGRIPCRRMSPAPRNCRSGPNAGHRGIGCVGARLGSLAPRPRTIQP